MGTGAGQTVSPSGERRVELVVALGASAGGLDALRGVVRALTTGSHAAFVVAQHQAPEHVGPFVELLSSGAELPIELAADGATLRADHILVGPPGWNITVEGDHVRLIAIADGPGPTPSIDGLFASVAEEWGPRSVAVVLSGTGNDGTRGVRQVRAAGGLAIAQDPTTAKAPSMPRAAATLGGADLTLAPEEIGARLSALRHDIAGWPADDDTPDPDPAVMTAIVASLRQATGVDFARYKVSTLHRQVHRRMAIRQVRTIDDYLPLLAADTAECKALAGNLLVTVTRFFRDPTAFTALRTELARYVAAHPASDGLRVWVPGCATGEEVYSLAMCCSEALGFPDHLDLQLKIFGTDLDEASLAIARLARYGADATSSVPEEFRDRFLRPAPEGVGIAEELRRCVVFARHDVGGNPPFPRMDLVSCRNTLIYFTTPLQEQVLDYLRFALVPGGLLLLGSADTIGTRAAGFAVVDAAQRIFNRARTADEPNLVRHPAAPPPAPSIGAAGARRRSEHDEQADGRIRMFTSLLRELQAPCLVLDERRELVEVVGDVSAYCRVPEGGPSRAGQTLLAPELRQEANALLLMTRRGQAPVSSAPVTLPGRDLPVTMVARVIDVEGRDLTVLSFEPAATSDTFTQLAGRTAQVDEQLERLERELVATQDSLREALSEQQALNEELQATAEELQASSEEIQASNEELEAANEELQATNEHLTDLNDRLHTQIEIADRLNTDLGNIERSSNQGMVIVDQELRVQRFTPQAVRVFALLDADIGRAVLDVPTVMPIPGLEPTLVTVVAGGERATLEATTTGQSFLVQVLPYRGESGQPCGAIITLTDVTEMVRLRQQAADVLHEFTRVTNAIEETVWERSRDLEQLLFVSEQVHRLTGWTAAELMARPALLDESTVHDDLTRVRAARNSGRGSWSIRFRFTTRDGRVRWFRETAGFVDRDGEVPMAVGTWNDVTEIVEVEQHANELSMTFEAVFNTETFGVLVLDAMSQILMVNQAFSTMTGFDRSVLVGMPMVAAITGVDTPIDAGSSLGMMARRLRRGDGTNCWVTIDERRLSHPVGAANSIVIVQDVSMLNDSIQQLARQARIDEAVTGLMNRSAFTATLQREIDRCQREGTELALVWLDLDRFKEVNDQHGHSVGDDVLRATADRLLEVVRSQESVGRLGGDEFGIIVSGFDRVEDLEPLFERVLVSLRRTISSHDMVDNVTASLGVATYPADGIGVTQLLRAADAAMYGVKSGGGNGFGYYTDSMNTAAEQRRTMRHAFATALEEHQFELYYQPIMHTVGTEPWGLEALIRWHRDGEVVSAGTFIDFVEESGQIREIGPLMFAMLREDIAALRAAGHIELPVCFNMSVHQLDDPAFAKQLHSWPTSAGLEGLVVEVTETVFLPDNERAMDALQTLVAMGAEVSIDDFGSGFSNLLQLSALSPAYVKLDRSMLTVAAEPSRGVALLTCAVDLAKALGARVVIEGIEGEAQLVLARALRADFVQGFHLARPMPRDTLLRWLVDPGVRAVQCD